jgi:hypothetical protein
VVVLVVLGTQIPLAEVTAESVAVEAAVMRQTEPQELAAVVPETAEAMDKAEEAL